MGVEEVYKKFNLFELQEELKYFLIGCNRKVKNKSCPYTNKYGKIVFCQRCTYALNKIKKEIKRK